MKSKSHRIVFPTNLTADHNKFIPKPSIPVWLTSRQRARPLGKRTRRPTFRQFIENFFSQNCIHGLAFLTKKPLTIIEKWLWIVLLIGSTVFCIIIGMQSVYRYKTKSIVIGVNRDYYIWRIKTTGLTICPMERLNVQLFNEFCRLHQIEGQRKVEFFDFLENLANSTYKNFNRIPEYESADQILDELHLEPKDYMKLIYNLTGDPTLKEEAPSSSSSGYINAHVNDVTIHTRQVLTEWGLCYNVNSVLSLEYTAHYMLHGFIKEEYKNFNSSYTVPEGTYFDTDISFRLFGFTSGMDLFLHSPYEVLHIDRNFGYFRDVLNLDVEIQEVVAEENLQKQTTVSQRQCRFANESNLQHFPLYTKNLCLQECRINLAHKLCKCIPHFYPNRVENPKPVCHYKQLKACFFAKKDYFLQLSRFQDKFKGFDCKCLDNCVDTNVYITQSFRIEASQNILDSFGAILKLKNFPTSRLIRQHIFTLTDLLVSIGGTAGLFLGFSVLGVIEIIYYFSLRLFWYLRGYIGRV